MAETVPVIKVIIIVWRFQKGFAKEIAVCINTRTSPDRS